MSNHLTLVDFYTSLLLATSHEVSEEGSVLVKMISEGDEVTLPAVLDGKQLLLPTNDLLANPPSNEIIFFHPMKEDLMRGPSEVLEYLRKRMLTEVQVDIGTLLLQILQLASEPSYQKVLSPTQADILTVAKSADKSTIERLTKLYNASVNGARETLPVNIFLKRSGKDDKTGEEFRWYAVVNFPLYEKILEDPKELLGVTLRIADRKAIKEVYEYLFPGLKEGHTYSYGSNSTIAPKLESLLGAYKNLRAQTITIYDLFKDHELFKDDTLVIETQWAEYVGNLEGFRKELTFLPMQEGNEGSLDVDERNAVNARARPEPTREPTRARSEPARTKLAEPRVAQRKEPTSGPKTTSALELDIYRGRGGRSTEFRRDDHYEPMDRGGRGRGGPRGRTEQRSFRDSRSRGRSRGGFGF